ncbi:MAG: 2Fe-2S iron-sulfur cluster-binding protein [Pseudomonadota bacterium]
MAQIVPIHVTFELPDGERVTHVGAPGDTVMDVALDNGVPGILAQCGGGCTCCTCHCWIAQDWLPAAGPAHQDELDLLEYAWGRSANSRLACQVSLTPQLDGITVSVPSQQS